MPDKESHVVTGAFGFSGKYIASRLLEAGHTVRTLTNSQNRENPFGGRVKAHAFCFDDYPRLVEAMRGASVLHNTYWVRFNYKTIKHSEAVANTLKLFKAAKEAGVKRVVHVSITNPSEESSLEYFKGKGRLERALIESGLSYAILRPAVLFGKEDILVNNIAWALRKFPIFPVFGDGEYRLQPIYVDDMAKLAVGQAARSESCIIDAIGPETFTYRGLAETIGEIIGKQRRIVGVPPWIGYAGASIIGRLMGDVMLTRDEIEGLMAALLYVESPPAGETKLTDWARQHVQALGSRYANELKRRKNRTESYENL